MFDNFPQKLNKVFPNLPRRFRKIDAFYENDENSEIVMFSGDEYITYDARGPIFMAYNLTRFTNDPDIGKIDAAMVWGENLIVLTFNLKIYDFFNIFNTS